MQAINKTNRKMWELRHLFKCYVIQIHCDKDGCHKTLWNSKRYWNISDEVKINGKINSAFSAQWTKHNIHHFTCLHNEVQM